MHDDAAIRMMVSDPMVQLVMRSDGVDEGELIALLRRVRAQRCAAPMPSPQERLRLRWFGATSQRALSPAA